MKIRPATQQDIQALAAAAAAQPLMKRYGRDAAQLEGLLRDGLAAGDGLIVADDGDPLGFAWYQLDAGLGVGGYLKVIALAPGAEGRGIGGRLLDEVEGATKAARKHLLLFVSDFNFAAQRFYERKGYVRVGRMEKLVHPDIDELLYWKRL